MSTTLNQMAAIKEMIQPCIQCGTCTGSCPNAFAMDHSPRQLWQMILSDRYEEVLCSKTFILCSSCYYCTLRCPRGLPLTRAMSALTRLARIENPSRFKKSHVFYKQFLESARRHGRVNETELMGLFFLEMKNPLLPLDYTGVGMKFILKKKISLPVLSRSHPGGLDKIFKKALELETRA